MPYFDNFILDSLVLAGGLLLLVLAAYFVWIFYGIARALIRSLWDKLRKSRKNNE